MGFEDLGGRRRPNANERAQVAAYFRACYGSQIHLCKRAATVLCVAAAMILSTVAEGKLFSAAASFACAAAAFSALRHKNHCKQEIQAYTQGAFDVFDVCITAIEDHPNVPNAWNVRLKTLSGQEVDGWFRIRTQGAGLNSRLILVSLPEGEGHPGHSAAFTPFMLTAEGIQQHF